MSAPLGPRREGCRTICTMETTRPSAVKSSRTISGIISGRRWSAQSDSVRSEMRSDIGKRPVGPETGELDTKGGKVGEVHPADAVVDPVKAVAVAGSYQRLAYRNLVQIPYPSPRLVRSHGGQGRA